MLINLHGIELENVHKFIVNSGRMKNCQVSTVGQFIKIIYTCSIINDMSTFVIEDHMLDWHSYKIYYSLEIQV